MIPPLINADFSQRVTLDTHEMPWIGSPQAGVERRMLDRIGGEVAWATSIVRYAAGSAFAAHTHERGEEFLVLAGVFSDEHGDYPRGTYVRNPPGSRHTPRSDGGCIILVKLRQMPATESDRVVIDTTALDWQRGPAPGWSIKLLYGGTDGGERVALERLEAGKSHPLHRTLGGEEIFVLSGELSDEAGRYGPGTWTRLPPGAVRRLTAVRTATFWVKRDHLGAGLSTDATLIPEQSP